MNDVKCSRCGAAGSAASQFVSPISGLCSNCTSLEYAKIIVCGGRDFKLEWVVNEVLEQIYDAVPFTTLISGHCRTGADFWAEKWARVKGLGVHCYPAKWEDQGRSAGPRRNQKMIDENPDCKRLVAFPGDTGTADMVSRARRANIDVYEVQMVSKWVLKKDSETDMEHL